MFTLFITLPEVINTTGSFETPLKLFVTPLLASFW